MVDTGAGTGASLPLGQLGEEITLVEGASFCISDRSGDIVPTRAQGLFFRDARLLSAYSLRVNGAPPEPLAASSPDPFSALFVGRSQPLAGRVDSTLMVHRRRYVGRGLREDIFVHNFGEEAAYCSVEVEVDTDFAPRFGVKEGRAAEGAERVVEEADDGVVIRARHGPHRRGVRVSFSEKVHVVGRTVSAEMIIPPRGEWSMCMQVTALVGDEQIEPRYRCGDPVDRAAPAERLARWRRDVPIVETDWAPLRQAVGRSLDDLGALRIFDPESPDTPILAAGAPWFMTVFGRDSLLTAWMTLIADPTLAEGVLHTLARFQGEDVNPATEEEPGKILHEMRFGGAGGLALGGGDVYYGSVDATPLFVMLLGELRRWDLDDDVVEELLPHADRALEWIEGFGDRDGDGYVEYECLSPDGLVNQGWKDSWDAVRFHDGALAGTPIALCEVQGYTYAAYVARAHFAREAGDEAGYERWAEKATRLRRQFNDDFWLEEHGWYALALDADKRPVDALASNIGHLLWTGIADPERAALVADRLLSPEMFSGWGIRTLATSMPAYNPVSYHNGSVWPHDTAIVTAGLMRYGFVEEAQRVVLGLLDAAMAVGGRLPELFGGLDRSELPVPLGYPASCSPQAWAAASPLLLMRLLLRFDPWLPHGKLWLDPVVPTAIGRLRVGHIPLGGGRLVVDVDGDDVSIEGLPPGIELVREPRQPLSAEVSEGG